MKIYVAHSSKFNYQDELYKVLRNSKLNEEHEITLPHENSRELFNTKEYLNTCDLVIAEVSYPSTSMGIELGWANEKGVKIVCIYKSGTVPSESLKAISQDFIEYPSTDELIRKLTNIL